MSEKTREIKLRRWAERLGLSLVKSRAKKFHIHDHGGYRIIDSNFNRVEYGENFDLTLDEVEAYLGEIETKLKK